MNTPFVCVFASRPRVLVSRGAWALVCLATQLIILSPQLLLAQTLAVDDFNPGANGSVNSLTLQADGRILVGGRFFTLGGQRRSSIGRLDNTEPVTEQLGFDDSTITWLRLGTSPEVWRTTFEASTNGTDWVILEEGTRIAGGWRLANVSLSANSSIRARGYTTGGIYNGSTWFVESTVLIFAAGR